MRKHTEWTRDPSKSWDGAVVKLGARFTNLVHVYLSPSGSTNYSDDVDAAIAVSLSSIFSSPCF